MIRFRLALFNVALQAISTDKTRPYLAGVFCHPHPEGGVVLVGTDGNVLTVIWDKEGEATECVILPKEVMTGWKPLAKHMNDAAIWSAVDNQCRVYMSHDWAKSGGMLERVFTVSAINGFFPAYNRVIPASIDASKAVPQLYSRVTVAKVDKTAGLWGVATHRGAGIGFALVGALGDPALVTLEGGNVHHSAEIVIVAMPLTRNYQPTLIYESPDWASVGQPAEYFNAA